MEVEEKNINTESYQSGLDKNNDDTASFSSVAGNGASLGKKLTLKSIFLGDFLLNDFLRRQALLLALVVIYTVIYISNRYSCQQEMIEIDRLHKELVDIKYDALTRSSELTERTRQSRIEEYVSAEESELQTSTNPPYVIKK